MKSLYKNHSVYFFKNKILMSLVTILFLSSFAVAPFFLNQSLLYNYNWLTYFIVYTIVILLSLTLCHFFLISSKKNQYDQILNSLYSNSRKIFISKYLFLLTAFSLLSFLIAIVTTLFMFITFKNNPYNFLYFFAILLSSFIVFNAFFWIFSLFSSFSKNLIYKNIANVSLGILLVFPIVLVKSFLPKVNENKSFSQIMKITEISKNKINKDYYVAKNYQDLNNSSNFNFDLINTFYFIPITLFNKIMAKNYDVSKFSNARFSTYFIDNVVKNKEWNNSSDYFIYDLNTKPLVSYNNNELLKLITKEIYKKVDSQEIIAKVRNIINKLEWKRASLLPEEINLIELLSGKNNKNIQYLRRDWKYFLANNNQLQNLIINNLNLDFWNLLNEFYNVYSFNAYLNIDIKGANFYFEKIITTNNEYDLKNKINGIDKEYLKNHFIYFSNNKVFFNNYKLSRFSISLDNFKKVFKSINNQDDWAKFIDENAFSLEKINNILESIYSFSNEFNNIEKIELLPNSSITKYYKDILIPTLMSDTSLNLVYTFLVLLMIMIAMPLTIFKAIKGEI
ncbi:ABC transporter permease [Metamycoplasma salivarium]|uniref:ABC transporter permease n=1 Tax=Metamycoplasma salivarium TaxID=2124 RepID=UPI001F25B699|nr:MFS transporter [Metamycoplasma salivarium]